MACWVKFHADLCDGDSRDVSRAARFVYMEIQIEARRRRADVRDDGSAWIPIISKGTVPQAIRDLIGGTPMEIVEAWKAFSSGPSPRLRVEEEPGGTMGGPRRYLVVSFYRAENKLDDSTERVQKYRDKKRALTENVTRDVRDGNALRLREEDREEDRDQSDPPQPPRSAGGFGLDGSEVSGGGSGTRTPPSEPTGEHLNGQQVMAAVAPPAQQTGATRGPRGRRAAVDAPAMPPAQRKPRGPSDSERRYAMAYAAGIEAASGGPFPPPLNPLDRRHFVEVLPVYAVDGAGEKLTGDALDAWIRRSAEAYRRAMAHRSEAGYRVDRWAAWLAQTGMRSPCVRAWFFGGDALEVWRATYAKSKRNYGTYVPLAGDAQEAAAVAEDLAAKVVAHAAETGVAPDELNRLTVANMELWSRQYLRLDGYNGGRQYVEHKHRFSSLRKNAEAYGTTWEPATVTGSQGIGSRGAGPVSQRLSSLQGASDGHHTPLRPSGGREI